jgi:hypothetical protein
VEPDTDRTEAGGEIADETAALLGEVDLAGLVKLGLFVHASSSNPLEVVVPAETKLGRGGRGEEVLLDELVSFGVVLTCLEYHDQKRRGYCLLHVTLPNKKIQLNLILAVKLP